MPDSKPYIKEFILNKINEYDKLIKEVKSNEYAIVKKNSRTRSGYMYSGIEQYSYTKICLCSNNKKLMSIDAKEIESSYFLIKRAKGVVGIVGLGLGYVVQELAKNDKVDKVIVYETSRDVIDVYNRNFQSCEKIQIINKDAFDETKKEHFNLFYVDIYEYKLLKRVVNDYIKLNKIHDIDEYSFWGMEHFLLSCDYNELLWIYIPENWVALSRDYYEALTESKYIDKYKPLSDKKVHSILMEFKKILND